MSDLHFAGTSTLAAKLRAREIGARELTQHFINRIEKLDGTVNAVVARDFEGALQAADAADARLALGKAAGSLDGVPMTIKDSFEVAGMPCTSGAPALKNHVPDTDADTVANLRAAGAHFMGKTNVPLMTGDFQSYNKLFGTTRNPWNTEHTPGGSSGGAAAALASGMTGGDIGSDLAGSIRTPSHFCGLFGLKPTLGIVSAQGHVPPAPGSPALGDLAVMGPMGRTAGDLDLMLRILAGDNAAALAPARAFSPKGLRVALWANPDDAFMPASRDVLSAVGSVASALEDDGATVSVDGRPEFDVEDQFEIYALLMHALVGSDFTEATRQRMHDMAAKLEPGDRSHEALQARGGDPFLQGLARSQQPAGAHRSRLGPLLRGLRCPAVSALAVRCHSHRREPGLSRATDSSRRSRHGVYGLHEVGCARNAWQAAGRRRTDRALLERPAHRRPDRRSTLRRSNGNSHRSHGRMDVRRVHGTGDCVTFRASGSRSAAELSPLSAASLLPHEHDHRHRGWGAVDGVADAVRSAVAGIERNSDLNDIVSRAREALLEADGISLFGLETPHPEFESVHWIVGRAGEEEPSYVIVAIPGRPVGRRRRKRDSLFTATSDDLADGFRQLFRDCGEPAFETN